jgi:hypothetical protein
VSEGLFYFDVLGPHSLEWVGRKCGRKKRNHTTWGDIEQYYQVSLVYRFSGIPEGETEFFETFIHPSVAGPVPTASEAPMMR